ncbi:MAG: glycosyltransferase family 39 protein [Flavobacteriales bacterium]|nr:glycosyltransferase family 39 protein [Flavobacteriales bacterium]
MIRKYPHIFISVLSLLLFLPFLGQIHLFDWDEINFAEASREMILTGNYGRVQIDFQPFWEKPPLFFWMQVMCMKVFGINEFAARLPNALCGLITLNVIFFYGSRLFSHKVAWWWILLFIGSFTPHFYFRSGIIDPFFNLFIFLSIVHLYLSTIKDSSQLRSFGLAGIWLGMAMLTKGPVAVILVGSTAFIYWAIQRFGSWFRIKDLLIFVSGMLIVPLIWFVPDWVTNGFWFTGEFLKYQIDLFLNPVASHGQPWYYHTVVLLTTCFPAALIAIPFLGSKPDLKTGGFLTWMKVLFWVVLVLFSAVTTKIVHYSSLCYLPLTFLAAWGLSQNEGRFRKWQIWVIGILGLIYSAVFLLIPLVFLHKPLFNWLYEVLKDDFVRANLKVVVNWKITDLFAGIFYLINVLLFFFYAFRKDVFRGLKLFLIGNAAVIFILALSIAPKVEDHVQGSIINFYKGISGKDVYAETVGFKSYAHYFYTSKVKSKGKLDKDILEYCKLNGVDTTGQYTEEERNLVWNYKKDWLLNVRSDKPVYLIYKITDSASPDTVRSFKKIMDKGGYKVYLKNKGI